MYTQAWGYAALKGKCRYTLWPHMICYIIYYYVYYVTLPPLKNLFKLAFIYCFASLYNQHKVVVIMGFCFNTVMTFICTVDCDMYWSLWFYNTLNEHMCYSFYPKLVLRNRDKFNKTSYYVSHCVSGLSALNYCIKWLPCNWCK